MAYSLVAHVSLLSTDGNGLTSASINTTGADFIVFVVIANNTISVSDSQGGNSNTWNLDVQETTFDRTFLYTCSPTHVGSGHTFTITGTSVFPAGFVAAFSGSAASPFDQSNHNAALAGTTIQPGSITPGQDNELLIAGVYYQNGTDPAASVDLSFTITDQSQSSGGQHLGGGLAYLIQTSAAAKNPSWSRNTGSADFFGAVIASYKAAAATGRTTKNTRAFPLGVEVGMNWNGV